MADCILRPRAAYQSCGASRVSCFCISHIIRPCWNVNPRFCRSTNSQQINTRSHSPCSPRGLDANMGLFRLFACANFNLALPPRVAKDLCFLRSTSRYTRAKHNIFGLLIERAHTRAHREGISPPHCDFFVCHFALKFSLTDGILQNARILAAPALCNNDFLLAEKKII